MPEYIYRVAGHRIIVTADREPTADEAEEIIENAVGGRQAGLSSPWPGQAKLTPEDVTATEERLRQVFGPAETAAALVGPAMAVRFGTIPAARALWRRLRSPLSKVPEAAIHVVPSHLGRVAVGAARNAAITAEETAAAAKAAKETSRDILAKGKSPVPTPTPTAPELTPASSEPASPAPSVPRPRMAKAQARGRAAAAAPTSEQEAATWLQKNLREGSEEMTQAIRWLQQGVSPTQVVKRIVATRPLQTALPETSPETARIAIEYRNRTGRWQE